MVFAFREVLVICANSSHNDHNTDIPLFRIGLFTPCRHGIVEGGNFIRTTNLIPRYNTNSRGAEFVILVTLAGLEIFNSLQPIWHKCNLHSINDHILNREVFASGYRILEETSYLDHGIIKFLAEPMTSESESIHSTNPTRLFAAVCS